MSETLTYSLDETSDAVFDIDSRSVRESRLASGGDAGLRETTPTSYAATVGVSDGKDPDGNCRSEDTAVTDATHAVTITLTDVDEPTGGAGGPRR